MFSPIMLKPSVQEYVTMYRTDYIYTCYITESAVGWWHFMADKKLPYFLKLPCIHTITVYPQTVRWNFYWRRVGSVCWRTSFMVANHIDTKVTYILIINKDSVGTGSSFPGGRVTMTTPIHLMTRLKKDCSNISIPPHALPVCRWKHLVLNSEICYASKWKNTTTLMLVLQT